MSWLRYWTRYKQYSFDNCHWMDSSELAPHDAPKTLPFQVIVETLKRLIVETWQTYCTHVVITGSTALRQQMSPHLRPALATGLVDLDLIVCCDLASFARIAHESYLVIYRFLVANGLDTTWFDAKPYQINKILVHKYFWHTFRFADVQWAAQPVSLKTVIVADNGMRGRSMMSSLDSLREYSERVLKDQHEGRPGDNLYRKEKDRARLACLDVPGLFSEPTSRDERTFGSTDLVALGQIVDRFASYHDDMLGSMSRRLDALKTRLDALGPLASYANSQLKRTQQYRVECDRRLSDKTEQMRRMEVKLNDQRAQLAQINKSVVHWNEERACMQRANAQLQEQLNESTRRAEQAKSVEQYLATKSEQLAQKRERILELEREQRVLTRRIDQLTLDRKRERLLAMQTVYSLLVAVVSFQYSMERASEYARAMGRSSSILYNLRRSLSSMFTCDTFHGTSYPTSYESKEPKYDQKDFNDFGREEIATAVRVFVEAFGPFGSREECDIMCAWKEHETVLDYLSRINSYIMVKMGGKYERMTLTESCVSNYSNVYLTSRTKCIMQSKSKQGEPKHEGGLALRVPSEPFSVNESLEPDDLDEHALVRQSYPGSDSFGDPEAYWMFEPIPSYMVEVKQDKLPDKEGDDRRSVRPFLREDWLKDPSALFPSMGQFAQVRSCANIVTTVAYAVWNRMSVSVISKIHKHARISSEILFRVSENENTAMSLAGLFLEGAAVALEQMLGQAESLDEAFIVYSPDIFSLVEDSLRPYALLKRTSPHRVVRLAKQYMQKMLPESVISRHETIHLIDSARASLSESPAAAKVVYPDPCDLDDAPCDHSKRTRLKAAIAQKKKNRAKR